MKKLIITLTSVSVLCLAIGCGKSDISTSNGSITEISNKLADSTASDHPADQAIQAGILKPAPTATVAGPLDGMWERTSQSTKCESSAKGNLSSIVYDIENQSGSVTLTYVTYGTTEIRGLLNIPASFSYKDSTVSVTRAIGAANCTNVADKNFCSSLLGALPTIDHSVIFAKAGTKTAVFKLDRDLLCEGKSASQSTATLR